MIFSLLIINKAGGLIYNREYNEGITRLSSNDYLVLAGTFHGYLSLHSSPTNIAFQCPRDNSTNITGTKLKRSRSPRSRNFSITVLSNRHWYVNSPRPKRKLTLGTKFLLITEPRQPNVDAVIRRIYELYSDYVMKNPFYQLEMPIRCEQFDKHLETYAKSIP